MQKYKRKYGNELADFSKAQKVDLEPKTKVSRKSYLTHEQFVAKCNAEIDEFHADLERQAAPIMISTTPTHRITGMDSLKISNAANVPKI
ncbi:MAG: hypothetical protein LBT24_02070 [Tannerella sp.]|nr:hypothetical protein [Tannerella sp.]